MNNANNDIHAARQYFGTDGVRGNVGTLPMTAQWVLHLAWAVGKMLADNGYAGEKVVIGKDTRISGYLFENAIVAGLSAAGMNSHLLGVMPTPAVAYFARTFHAAAAIVVSASHNPYHDNGVKIFAKGGVKLSDAQEMAIENYIKLPMQMVAANKLGKAYRITESRGRYIEFCKNSIPLGLPFERLKIVVDCANGATYAIAPEVLRELGAQVIEIATKPNGININAECGSTNPQQLLSMMRQEGADVGIAYDGDGDRVIMIDGDGKIVDGDMIVYIIAKYRAFIGEKLRDVVGTQMTNLGLERALRNMGITLHRTAVGDRYVLEKMNELAANIGGENSGHVICLDRNSTGDGIVASLQVLAAMLQMQRTLAQLLEDLQLDIQILKNIAVRDKKSILQSATIANAISVEERQLGDDGRILVRASGTEELVRVMCEGRRREQVLEIVERLSQLIEKEEQNA